MSAKREKWKDVPGWFGYQVSNMGNVRSRWATGGAHRGLTNAWHTIGKNPNRYGYRKVMLCNGKRQLKKNVHVLVMLAFVGPVPKGHEVNHKDGMKANCRLQNLEYATPSQNMRHAVRIGLRNFRLPSGADSSRAKFTNEQVAEIRRMYAELKTPVCEIARKFGVAHSTISRITSRKRYA